MRGIISKKSTKQLQNTLPIRLDILPVAILPKAYFYAISRNIASKSPIKCLEIYIVESTIPLYLA